MYVCARARPRGADVHAGGRSEAGLLREWGRLCPQSESLLRAASQMLLVLLLNEGGGGVRKEARY